MIGTSTGVLLTPQTLTAAQVAQVQANLQITAPVIILSVKNVAVATAGGNQDIATIAVPSWITRFTSGAGAAPQAIRVLAESAVGTLASASFTARDTAGGAGTAITGAATGPAAAGLITAAIGIAVPFTGVSTIHIWQIGDSVNAGVVSIYLIIYPLLT